MLLAIDTSTRYAGVALSSEGRVQTCRSWFSTRNHTAELMPTVASLLREQGIALRDLTGISIALGPGGFSALRVGMSAAKGLALALDLPLVGVGTLDLEAHPLLESGLPVCAWLDAGRKEVATALFGVDGVRTRDDIIGEPQELLEGIEEQTIICGEGAATWTELIRQRLGSRAVVAKPNPMARTCSLAELGGRELARGRVDDLAALQPYYLRMPSIGGPKRRDQTRQQP